MHYRIFLSLFFVVLLSNAHASDNKKYLEENHLYEAYQHAIQSSKDDKYQHHNVSQLDNRIEAATKSPLNETYKLNYLQDLIKSYPYFSPVSNPEFVTLYGVRYDPLGSIKYLEGLENREISENFQLLTLWQIYQPEKITTNSYQAVAQKCHEDLMAYFSTDKWQAEWQKKEYNKKIGDNYQNCYKDLKCFLSIIPYWLPTEVYVPCDVAQKYDIVAYFNTAGGGFGAESFITSDCMLYDKYSYPDDLNKYTDMLFKEGMYDSAGSFRYLYQASSLYKSLIKQYSPKFDLEQQKKWNIFPYTEWAVKSYYNFIKYNEVLNYGIGYQKAIEKLSEHYVKNFGVTEEQAYNTALYILKIPSMDDYELITKDNLYYMLLTGTNWQEIERTHKDIKDYQNLLEFSIAHPENLKKIIELGKAEKDFDIDYPNWFGKTPLMTAAQYGHLDAVKLLLENGADINKQTSEGDCWSPDQNLCITHGKRTALMYAAQEGKFEIIEYLLKMGADVNLQDTENLTAYDYMQGEEFAYNPHIKPTINGGGAAYWKTEDKKSAFSAEQIKKLTPLLKVK